MTLVAAPLVAEAVELRPMVERLAGQVAEHKDSALAMKVHCDGNPGEVAIP
jgi:hypothetical protein